MLSSEASHDLKGVRARPEVGLNLMCLEARTKFDGASIPSISMRDYLARFRSYTKCSDFCIVVALIYVDRAIQKNSGLLLSRYNMHRQAV